MAKKVTKKAVTGKKTGTTKTVAKKKAATSKRAAAPKSAKSAVATRSVSQAVSDEQVRVRAYEIYRSGRNASNPDLDWVQAEQELRAELRS